MIAIKTAMMQHEQHEPIDIVVPWVDSTDPAWRQGKAKYEALAGFDADDRDFRYRDWGIFKYWFRSVETYAPWINKIHLITCGHLPEWLNCDHPKLNVVRHEDYIPAQYLPTFSSHTIELNMHRIPGLAEKFVYFNDDIFLSKSVSPNMYFRKGLPTDSAIMNALNGGGFHPVLMNDIRIINKVFSKKEAIKRNPLQWISLKYGVQGIRNILLLPWGKHTGFFNLHMPNSYLKCTLEKVWSVAANELDATCRRRFRSDYDVNQYLFQYWQLAGNNFYAVAKQRYGSMLQLGVDPMSDILHAIHNSRRHYLCLNDHAEKVDEKNIKLVQEAMESRFPQRSRFEV